MVKLSPIGYGLVIIGYFVLNFALVLIPYTKSPEKALELTILPLITLILLVAVPKKQVFNVKFDALLLLAIFVVAACVFHLPDPTLIWLMMIFVFLVYIPANLILLSRGLICIFRVFREKAE